MKIRMPKIATRPATGPWRKREDLLSDGGARSGRDDCFSARQGGLFWRRRDRERSERLRLCAPVGPGGNRNDGLDLVNRDRPCGQEATHNDNAKGDTTLTMLPTSHASRADAEQLGNMALRKAKRAERLAELVRSRGALVLLPEVFSRMGRCFLPFRVV